MGTYWHINKVFINHSMSSTYIPILAYHNITSDNGPTTQSDYALTVSQFESQMRFLSDQGYSSLNLMDLFQSSITEESQLKKVFVLTFDDGFEDFYSHAYLVLRRYGFIATVFLVSDLITKVGDYNDEMKTSRMTWEQIYDLKAEGISFGSHTCSHPRLPELDEHQIRHELIASKESLEASLGQEVPYLAYPYGESNSVIQKIAMQAGYQAAFGVQTGEPSLFNIWRTEINTKDSLQTFILKMTRFHSLYLKSRGWMRESTAIGSYLRKINNRFYHNNSSNHS